jgi:hypothetical protein
MMNDFWIGYCLLAVLAMGRIAWLWKNGRLQ